MGFVTDMLGLSGGSDFKAKAPDIMTTDYRDAIKGSLGNVTGGEPRKGQMDLIKVLQAAMTGEGPSLAQEQLKSATNRNMQQAAAFGGSQRGISPALMARQILQNQSAINQNSAGQAAELRAQEDVTNKNLLSNVLSGTRGQDVGEVGTLGGLQNTQSGIQTSGQLGADQINAKTAQDNAKAKSGAIGGLINGVASVAGNLGNIFGAGGGEGTGGGGGGPGLGVDTSMGNIGKTPLFNEGGFVEAYKSYKKGGKVPGHAEAPGDSPKNDTVKAMLSPDEIVIPRSISHDPEAAKEFVEHVNNGQRSKGSKAKGYARVLEAHRELTKELKKMAEGGLVEEC